MNEKTQEQIAEVRQEINEIKKEEDKQQELEKVGMKKKNWIPFILGAMFIITIEVIGALVYVNLNKDDNSDEVVPPPSASPEAKPEDDTKGWQTIVNTNCGFEIRIPNEWKDEQYFIEKKDADCAYLVSGDYKHELDTRSGNYLHIKRYALGADFSDIDEFIHDSEKLNQIELEPVKKEEVIIGLLNGFKFLPYGYDQGMHFALVNSGFIYDFAWPRDGGEEIAQKILSTFKFVEDTRNWQTYRNDEYGFELKFPKEYEFKEVMNYGNGEGKIALISPATDEDTVLEIHITAHLFDEYSDIDDWLHDLDHTPFQQVLLEEQEIFIDRQRAILRKVKQSESEHSRDAINIYTSNEKHFYSFFKSPIDSAKDEEFDKILASFKFI